MLVVGRVAERNIGKISLGNIVKAELITGDKYEASVSFIGRAPDDVTRTYLIEATIDNPGESVRTGLSTTMQVPIGSESAHLISSASGAGLQGPIYRGDFPNAIGDRFA